MSNPEVRIPIPENATVVKIDERPGTFFLDPNPEKPEFTWVMNVLGTDGASYRFTPDKVLMTSYSTHDEYYNNKHSVFENPSRAFWEWQGILQEVIDAANSSPTK